MATIRIEIKGYEGGRSSFLITVHCSSWQNSPPPAPDTVGHSHNFCKSENVLAPSGISDLNPPVPVGNLIWLAVDRESGDAAQ